MYEEFLKTVVEFLKLLNRWQAKVNAGGVTVGYLDGPIPYFFDGEIAGWFVLETVEAWSYRPAAHYVLPDDQRVSGSISIPPTS